LNKSISVFIIPFVISGLTIISNKITFKRTKLFLILSFIVFQVGLTLSSYAADFRNTARPITSQFLELQKWDVSTPKDKCVISFGYRGRSNINFRYFDRTFDFIGAIVFRNHIVVDPWTNSPVVGEVSVESFRNSNVCAIVNREIDFATYNQLLALNKTVLFASSNWFIFDLDSKLKEHTNGSAFEVWQGRNYT
jgi:hypothetical protein